MGTRFVFRGSEKGGRLTESNREPTTVCNVCGESVRFSGLRKHRVESHPEFVELSRKLRRRFFMVTGPGGGILAALLVVAVWSRVTWIRTAFLVAIPLAFGSIVLATYRATRQLRAFYEKQNYRCQVCLEMIPKVAFRDHMKSLHPETWTLAVRLGVTGLVLVVGVVVLGLIMGAYPSPSGPEDPMFAIILVSTALGAMVVYAVAATHIWRRHRERVRTEWKQKTRSTGP